MKKESEKDHNKKLEAGNTAQKKYGKDQEKREVKTKRKQQESREKRKDNQKERARLCAALSLGVGTILFSVWAFSGSESGYMNASGYMALQKAAGKSASVGVLVSEKKAGKDSRKEENDKAEKMASSESETETETESETDTEKETDPGSEGKAVMETEEKPELGAEMEITVGVEETEREPETYPETEIRRESETQKDTEPETEEEHGAASEAETEEKTDQEKETSVTEVPSSGKESEKESETGITTEEITEDTTENNTENKAPNEEADETEKETYSECESEIETEIMTEYSTEETLPTEESEGETASEYESESETESDTEKVPSVEEESETESEKHSEYESEAETEITTENETEVSRETETEIIVQKPETEVEKESEIEPETKKEPETSPSLPEPLPVQRGEQYEIRGDENAWYRDEAGHLWVRRGSSVYVDPAKRQGYTNGGSITDVQQDGMLTFQLKKTDANGNVIGISTLQQEAYFVDGEVPEARIEPSGNLENGVIYAAQSSAVTVTVPPDGKSGLKRVSYRISSGGGENDSSSGEENWTDWVDCRGSEQINISGEGIYRLYVRTEDRVGNLAFSSSVPICVDCTPPQIEIEGVQGETANAGSVPIRVKCSDSFYRSGSLEVKIVGANNGKVPKIRSSEEKKDSARTEFFDFPKEKAYDDAYRLEVRAEDLAGNATQKTLDFSINRFGSVYDLSGETKEALQPYYLTEAEDIVFLEMNIDYVGESEIFCRENGELKKLNRGSDYTVELQGSSDSWKQYRYTIPAEYFEKEGVYELLLASRDRANNESDTGLQGKQVTFALDWTAPECLITGVEALGIYQAEHQTACIQPKDNLGISQARVYCDSELVQTTEEDGAPVKLKLDAKREWQTIQVYVKDLAGNETWSPEIPVFISSETKEVLPYEKTRKSAQEKSEELIRRKAGYGAGGEETADFEEKEQEKEAQGRQTAEEGASMSDEPGGRAEKDSLFGRTERIRRGRLLLGFGTLLFFVTFLVCILPLGKWKR